VNSGVLAAHFELHQYVAKNRSPVEQEVILENNANIGVGLAYYYAIDENQYRSKVESSQQ
jgi:hypothetical protein